MCPIAKADHSRRVRDGQDGLRERTTSVFIGLLLTIFLLGVPGSGYLGITALKYKLFLGLCGGYVLISILIPLELALVGKRRPESPAALWRSTGMVQKLMLLYLLITAVSALVSRYSGVLRGGFRQEGLLTVAVYVLAFLLVSRSLAPKRWMLYLLGGSTTLFCLLCIVQLAGKNPLGLYPAGYDYYDAGVHYSGAYLGTIGNTNLSAAFLCVAAGIFAMALIRLTFKSRWLLALPLFLAVFVILEAQMEAGIVGLGGGLLLMLPVAVTDRASLANTLRAFAVVATGVAASAVFTFSRDGVGLQLSATGMAVAALTVLLMILSFVPVRTSFFSKASRRAFFRGTIAFILVILAAALVFLWSYSGPQGGFLYEASELLHGRAQDDFGSGRVYIWRSVLAQLGSRFWLGTGPDTLGYWELEPFTRYHAGLDAMLVSDIDAAHNEYLNILACQGVFALAAYLGALALAAKEWVQGRDNPASAIAGAGVLFYCIQAFFGISMCITAPYFWVALAALKINIKQKTGG